MLQSLFYECVYTENISIILNDKGYKMSVVETGRLMNRIVIGKYNEKCNIDKCKKKSSSIIITSNCIYLSDDSTN